MKTTLRLPLALILTVSALHAAQQPAPQPASKPAPKPAPKFVRFLDDGDHKGKLQTGVVTYKNQDGVTVDLIAVIHMADRAYFKQLEKEFEAYDALLYEITKPKGESVNSPKIKNHPMRMMMRMQTRMMGLAGQMETIDYEKPNFVHADLDLETFERLCKEKGDSIMAMMMKSQRSVQKVAGRKGQGGMPFMNPFGFGRGKDGTSPQQAMKYAQARQMQYMEQAESGFTAGEKGVGSVLLIERNKKCMEVLGKRLEQGDQKLGIFYGAAHMPDFEQRLQKLGFKKTGQRWNTAWDIGAKKRKQQDKGEDGAKKRKRRTI